jgi:hypothetical protein
MIYAIYINGVYKRCSEGATKPQALNAALDKGMHLLISDKVVLKSVHLLETKIGEEK